MAGFDTILDKVLETGAGIYNRVLDRDIAASEAKAQEAARKAEETRLSAIDKYASMGFYENDASMSVFGYSIPSWVLPASALAVAAVFVLKKVK